MLVRHPEYQVCHLQTFLFCLFILVDSSTWNIKAFLEQIVEDIYDELCKNYMCDFDDRGTIGKRYRREDEIGTPYCITYDFDSENDNQVTIRERDSMEQVRIPIASLKEYFADKFIF